VVGVIIEVLMKAVASKLLLLGCVLGSAAGPAAAQTGRIAHYSHGGSAATLAGKETDNFGLHPMPTAQWKADTLTCQSDSVAIHSGSYRSFDAYRKPETSWHRKVEEIQYAGRNQTFALSSGEKMSVGLLRELYPNTVLVGFDKLKKPVPKKLTFPKAAPRKPAGQIQAFPKRPFQYSSWRGLAGVAALGVVGWLLGRKPGATIC